MLFAVALHCVANNYFAGEQAEQDTYMAMSVLKGDTHELLAVPRLPTFLMPNWPEQVFRFIKLRCHVYSAFKQPNMFSL